MADDEGFRRKLFYVIIILIIILGIWLVRYVHSNSYSCMNNPIVYGIQHMNTNIGDIQCECSAGSVPVFIATNETIISLNQSAPPPLINPLQ